MQVLVLFSQCQASVCASSMGCKPRLYFKNQWIFLRTTVIAQSQNQHFFLRISFISALPVSFLRKSVSGFW